MIQQHVMMDKNLTGRVFDFIEYKKQKPFFPKPLTLKLGNPINDTYEMVKNVVYKEKQILALKKEQEPDTILLVEAMIEDGQLIQVSKLGDEHLLGLTTMLEGIM